MVVNELPSVTDPFFIVGAPRAGTTWLAAALARHEEVHMSPIKEPHFFAPPVRGELGPEAATDRTVWKRLDSRGRLHNGHIRDWSNYKRLLTPPHGGMIVGEATVAYLHAPLAAGAIAEKFPEARIIAILREPVSRALSHIQIDRVSGLVDQDAEDILRDELDAALQRSVADTRYLSRSRYADALDRYVERFGRSRMLILRFDDIQSSPDAVLGQVCSFLDVSAGGFQGPSEQTRNDSKEARWQALNYLLNQSRIKNVVRRGVPPLVLELGKRMYYRKPKVQPLADELMVRLSQFFDDDIRRTEAICGLDLSYWRCG